MALPTFPQRERIGRFRRRWSVTLLVVVGLLTLVLAPSATPRGTAAANGFAAFCSRVITTKVGPFPPNAIGASSGAHMVCNAPRCGLWRGTPRAPRRSKRSVAFLHCNARALGPVSRYCSFAFLARGISCTRHSGYPRSSYRAAKTRACGDRRHRTGYRLFPWGDSGRGGDPPPGHRQQGVAGHDGHGSWRGCSSCRCSSSHP
jgi:hypothetical protein